MQTFDSIILAVAGPVGSGKWTVSSYLERRYAAKSFMTSLPLRQILSILGLEINRTNMAGLSKTLRDTYGSDIIARMAKTMVLAHDVRISIIDGTRRISDIEAFLELPNFFLVYVDADVRTRYERIVKRAQNSGDSDMTFERFLEEEQLETESSIRSLRPYAKYVLGNDGDEAGLMAKTDAIIGELLGS